MNSGIFKTIYIMGSRMRGTPVVPYLHDLEESQWWDIDQIRKYQLEKLRGLLTHAERHSVFYRNIFEEHGFNTGAQSLDDLEKLPAVSKDEIGINSSEIQNDGLGGKLILSKTSGSTGEPLKFYRGSEWDAQHRAAVARGYGWYGVHPWTKSGLLWGLPAGTLDLFKTRIEDFLQNRFREKRFDLSVETLESFYQCLTKAGFLEGYSSMIYELARFINTYHADGRALALSLVKGTSEKIYPHYHTESLKAFGRRMTSEYGAAETGIIAFECPEGNMHINMEHVIVEEEDGEIIVTNLLSHSFPFIRYRLGDHIRMASNSPCPCGRQSPVISQITGRIGKKIFGRSGRIFPSLTVYYILNTLYEDFPGLLRLQAVQGSEGRLDFLVILDDRMDAQTMDGLKQSLEALVKKYYFDEIDVRLLPVESISRGEGKKVDFVSSVDHD
jgi:phenylacetate-CoA ligase